MVLCPYVHLVMRYNLAPLTLQPAEVKSAHWVSFRALMSPHLRTFERQDVSDRFFRQNYLLTRRILRSMVGQLLFTARTLVPTESSHSRPVSDYAPAAKTRNDWIQILNNRLNLKWRGYPSVVSGHEPPLVLWGLTYDIVANLLGLM